MFKNKLFFIVTVFILIAQLSTAQVKILFDATKAETAGSADWIIDADQWNLNWNPNAYTNASNYHSNAQRIPTPAQSGITASTAESYWTGALSAWGVDCAKKGYTVETLPWNGQITYGNSANAQDLSNYKVYIVCEPNIQFTAAEKTAMMHFVQNGGGLFMISDHTNSDRNNDGWDSPAIWNDFLTTNSIQSNPFGISFDLQDFSGVSTAVFAAGTDSIIHGPMGNVAEVQWANGTSMTLSPSANATVKGVVYKSGTSSAGNTNALVAYARYGSGKVAAIGDSSPCDDGTGNTNSNITLYNGYFTDAAGNHQKLLMNITIWLATTGTVPACNAPTGLAASGITSSGANLSWAVVTGATGYEYVVNTTATAPLGSGTATTGTSYTASGLTASTTYYLHVRTNCGSGNYSSWTTFQFTTLAASGIANTTTNELSVYPNPVKDVLHLDNIKETTTYRILNVIGTTMAHGILLTGSNSINTQSLATGLYMIELTNNDGARKVVRIVKN